MPELLFATRFVHVAAGVAWVGEVATVASVLFPALRRADEAGARVLLESVFPRVFRLATVLGGTALVSGAILAALTPGGVDRLLGSTWGLRILAGGLLGAVLFGVHLFLEPRLERRLRARVAEGTGVAMDDGIDLRILLVAPRVGLLVLLTVIGLMAAAARLP
jgi:hypothetical protein